MKKSDHAIHIDSHIERLADVVEVAWNYPQLDLGEASTASTAKHPGSGGLGNQREAASRLSDGLQRGLQVRPGGSSCLGRVRAA